MLAAVLFVLAEAAVAPPPPPAMAYNGVRSAGKAHVCAETAYPLPALQTETEGNTIMSFTVAADGHVRDISVTISSGNADLDAASKTCAADWIYRPATKDGVPIDAPWRARVRWRIVLEQPYAALASAAKSCLKQASVTWEELRKLPLRPVVRMRFVGGVVQDVKLVGSTGDADLDARALACYRGLPAGSAATVPDGDELLVITKPDE